jgi:CRISPR-associated protein Cas1
LGNGVSISSEAAMICAKHGCYIAFVKGGLNAHSVWHCGRYSKPENLVRQVKNHSDPVKRIEIAKNLMRLRLKHINENFVKSIDLNSIDRYTTIEQILGLEGSITRKTYAALNSRNGVGFKRDSQSREGINSSLTIANNALYNYVATILISLGLSPSIGFLHGQTRRGGLVFDIADVFKYPVFMEEVFSGQFSENNQALMREMSRKLSKSRNFWTKEIISVTQELICS